ncbi:hypothetical protein HYU19_04225 [Candidatus Woesearchaeota archaeon]|nr:hypothetical protein [Candidatus Woesearchaeota archaeon]
MGKQKYVKDVEQLLQKSAVVSYRSIERIINEKKNVRQYTKQLIRNFIRQGKLFPLTKGWYAAYEDTSLAVFCFQPAYLGLQDALSYHNAWEQETIPIIITTKKVRQGVRKVFGSNILIRRIDPAYFFGITYSEDTPALPYSGVEKTLLDFLYFHEQCSPETRQAIMKKIDRRKLKKYTRQYPLWVRRKVSKM